MSRKIRVCDCTHCHKVMFVPPKPRKDEVEAKPCVVCEHCFYVVDRDELINSRLMTCDEYYRRA